LSPEAKQALRSFASYNYSTSHPSQNEPQVTELPSDANSPPSNNGSTSNPSQNEPLVTELPSDANSPPSNDSSTSNPSQNEPQATEPSSSANSPSSNGNSTLDPSRYLQIAKLLSATRFHCLLEITQEELCINPKIRIQFVEWTDDWTRLFTASTDQQGDIVAHFQPQENTSAQLQPQGDNVAHLQPQENTTAHFQPQGYIIAQLQPQEDISARLRARYDATVCVQRNALTNSIRWRFLMVFYDELREIVRDTEALATFISNSIGIKFEVVKKNIDTWVSDGRKWRALGESLSWGCLFLLPASICDDS